MVNTDRLWSASEWTSRRRAPPLVNASPIPSIVPCSRPSETFGTDSSGNTFRTLGAEVKAYYHARAREYDDWWLGRGLYRPRMRPGWDKARAALERAIAELPAGRTLDVACGTGFMTRRLRGEVVALDQSEEMLAVAA